jgi:hypothetical protein
LKPEFDCTEVRAPISKGLQGYTKVWAFHPKHFNRQSRRLRYGENIQHPVGAATPGVAAAPVAFAGAIMAGLARSIEMLSLHAAEFGVGITTIAGSMLVLPRRPAAAD